MSWKRILFLVLVLLLTADIAAQTDTSRRNDTGRRRIDTVQRRGDSPRIRRDTVQPRRDTANRRTDTTNRRSDTTVRRPPTTITTTTPVPPTSPTPTPAVADTAITGADSTVVDSVAIVQPPVVLIDTSTYAAYFTHPFMSFDKPAVNLLMKERIVPSKDRVFYLLVGLLFFAAFIRLLFPRYFQNTFRLFFQTSFRQKQTRDQLLQQGMGSLLLNLLFFFSAACYLALLLEYLRFDFLPFWQLLLYSLLLISLLYIGKFLFLKFAGWVFHAKEGAETYIFIVFLVNKIIGVMLIPFVLVIAFARPAIADAAITASLILLGFLFVYRYFVSLKSFRRDLHISPFHFFLYLCGVEIVPLLVIGKAVFNYIDGGF